MAERLNASNRTVSKWETGDGYPDITILPNLSDILEISIDELICGEELCEIAEKEQATTDDRLNKSKTNTAEGYFTNPAGVFTWLKIAILTK